ncbi:sterol desaturase family protein [Mesorhizobium tianshanense]|uniref:Sterol desaturase/sphingolipid hydroxylase (Fatty acid hydroxylase superfamily) n=1 Tax=Mesorhizobium tianshanense TaxID=39844 RepID=A0A562N756_9HYPH|nr:sterol desaturase family protein [Mesorhizobium tianshanense]TWI27918.1 sterol desaturase/sphingolipid hydroxylase (fatty acid hydroxylase superfamily) [Mesorhizobium tianshanense]
MLDTLVAAPLVRFAADIYPLILQNDLYRYLLGAGGTFLVINVLLSARLASRKIRDETPDAGQIAREILASLRTVFIFSLVGLTIAILANLGMLPVHEDPAQYGWTYFAINVVALIVAHDAWFYWTHWIMHRPKLFRRFHLLHHRSHNPTPWTAYAFNVSEAFVNAVFLLLFMVVMPTSVLAAFIFTAHMMARNAIGHCGYEVFPANRDGRPLFDWIAAVTHHDLHHARPRTNFGLYFTWWDKIMGTEDPTYYDEFRRAVTRCALRTSRSAH